MLTKCSNLVSLNFHDEKGKLQIKLFELFKRKLKKNLGKFCKKIAKVITFFAASSGPTQVGAIFYVE